MLQELRRAIVERELLPGTPIRQDDLAQRLGVSRVPIREALKILEAEGHVEYVPYVGFAVTRLSPDDLREVYTIRRALEELAAERAVELADDEDLAKVEAAMEAAAAALASGDTAELTAANRAFHFAILEPCRLPRLLRLLRTLWESTEPYRPVYFMDAEPRELLQKEHREIADSLRQRDLPRFTALLSTHRENLLSGLLEAYDEQQAPGRS